MTNVRSPAEPLLNAWAKLDHSPEGLVQGWRSLTDHCLDVATVCRTLLEIPTLRKRLARLAGLTDLTPAQRDRLAVLAGLHDLGKANWGFQNKGFGAGPKAGHLGEILALVADHEALMAQELLEATDLASMVEWFRAGEQGLIEALYAIFSHHGRPLQPPDDFPSHLWRTAGNYDPLTVVRECVATIQAAFPESTHADPLPDHPPLMHGFLGLLTLADWIGSDKRFFPLLGLEEQKGLQGQEERRTAATNALHQIGLRPPEDGHRERADDFDWEAFQRVFGFPPNPVQEQALEAALPDIEGSLLILEAETGSGKTEMALAWFLRLYRAGLVEGLYFALPTRAAAVQIHERVSKFVQATFGKAAPEVVRAVSGYTPPEDMDTPGIQSDGRRYGERVTESDPSWAAEHPKRYMAGRLVVGTVDQVLLSGLQVKHAHMRATALLRHLLVVDEVHASDPYMARVLEGVLQRHQAAGGHALLLSATLGEADRTRFLAPGALAPPDSPEEAAAQPYPALWANDRSPKVTALPRQEAAKAVSIELHNALADPEVVARKALEAAAAGARVGILRNTVGEAVATQQALEATNSNAPLFTCHGIAAPHHSRFAREDRIRLDWALEQGLLGDGPLIVAATQTIEQSLDIDFDLLITDLCPIDVLLQRLGRVHRHSKRCRPTGFKEPRAVVLTPEGDLGEYLRPNGKAHGPAGLGVVYDDLGILESTRQVLAKISILRVPDDSRALIERVLHPEQLRAQAEALGGPWMEHWSRMWGLRTAQEGTAGLNTANWSKPLSQTRFNEPGEAIRTRLGTDSRRLALPADSIGIFGDPITEITVPGWMAEGISDEPTVEVEKHNGSGLVIRADNRRYRYDRFGLRPEENPCD